MTSVNKNKIRKLDKISYIKVITFMPTMEFFKK